MNLDPNNSILILSAAAGLYVKILIDILRLQWPDMQDIVAPIIAVVGGILFVILIEVANDIVLTSSVIATCVLAGFLAGGSAITATAVQKKAADIRTVKMAARTRRRQRVDIEAVPNNPKE